MSVGALSNPDSHRLSVPAPPWDYNPSAWRQRIPICILAMVAFVMASWMAVFQWGFVDHVWDPVFGMQTDRVVTSATALKMHHWFRIPDAAFGAFAYLGDAIFGLAGSTRRWQYRPWLVLIFGFDVIPLGIVSIILVGVQTFVLGQWCFLCLVTAVISMILIYMAYDEVWSSLVYLHRVWKETGDRRILWDAFCGRATPEASAIAEAMIKKSH